jgi:hypothetical protein
MFDAEKVGGIIYKRTGNVADLLTRSGAHWASITKRKPAQN